MGGVEQDLRIGLVETCRAMGRLGPSSGTSGNVSVRHGERPDQVVRMRGDQSYEGDVVLSSEWRFLEAILDDRPELNAVVHTHSRYATAVTVLGHDIPAIQYAIAGAGAAPSGVRRMRPLARRSWRGRSCSG